MADATNSREPARQIYPELRKIASTAQWTALSRCCSTTSPPTFPDLTISMTHPSVPWQDSAIAVAQHKANVYRDLSGWSPKYFPPQLVRAANTLLKTKVLFGSDYPLLRPERWLKDFAELDIKDDVRPLIMKENAVRALGLAAA